MRMPKSFCYDNCRLGASFLNLTKVSFNVPGLGALEQRCRCAWPHAVLRGVVRLREGDRVRCCWKISLAVSYPPALCRAWAKRLLAVALPSALRRSRELQLAPNWNEQCWHVVGEPPLVGEVASSLPARWAPAWKGAVNTWGHWSDASLS